METQNPQGGNEPPTQNLPPFDRNEQPILPPPNSSSALPPSTDNNGQNIWAAAVANHNANQNSAHSSSNDGSSPSDNSQYSDDEDNHRKGKFKRLLIVILVILLLFFLFWFIFLRGGSEKSGEEAIKDIAEQAEQIAADVAQAPDLLNFAARADNEGTYTIYNLPADGGDKVVARRLDVSETPKQADVEGNMVLYGTLGGYYLSQDGGRDYTEVIHNAILDEITSAKISKDKKGVAYGLLNSEGVNVVRAYDNDTGKVRDLFSNGDRSVFIHAWNANIGKMIYSETCNGCNSPTNRLILRDLNTGATKEIYNDSAVSIISIETSEDFKTMLFVTAAIDTSLYGTSINASGPPYTVRSMNLDNASSTVVETFGSKGEKRPDGSIYFRNIWVGFTTSPNPKPYFAEGRKITVLDGQSKNSLYEFDQDIQNIGYVSDITIVAGVGTANKWTINKYSVQDKKAERLFDGDRETVVFGVSNK